MSPLSVAVLACAAVAALCWLLSELLHEHSWVDRLWSIVPPLYVAWFAYQADFLDTRLNVMTWLAALWGARLTYNFARKGGYRPGGEDYRWAELRRRMSPRSFRAFNLLFIAAFQNALLLLITLPAHAALQHGRDVPFGALDVTAALLFLVFLAGETLADQQQWEFQRAKQARLARGEYVRQGFLSGGLFRYSRHPNFFCEQAMWWSFYLFSIAAGGGLVNATIAGPILLTLLFHGSTEFTEQLSRKKYPAYADYQQTTPRLIPGLPRR